MYWIQYVLLFACGILLSMGAYLNRARGYSGILGIFVWFIIGNASIVLVIRAPGTGTEYVYESVAMQWLAYGNAAMHFVVTLLAVHEAYEGVEDEADDLDPATINDRLETRLSDS